MTIYDVDIDALTGGPAGLDRYRGSVVLVVNVASRCGLTPQYTGLQKLYETYQDRGLVVLGVPCNQFGAQEPGTASDIEEFCQVNYGVTFPLTEKVVVNGAGRHPIYRELTAVADAAGQAGDIRWNFEKFVVSADGATITRFGPQTAPDDPAVLAAIDAGLPR